MGGQILSLRVDPFSEVRETILTQLPTLKTYKFPLNQRYALTHSGVLSVNNFNGPAVFLFFFFRRGGGGGGGGGGWKAATRFDIPYFDNSFCCY